MNHAKQISCIVAGTALLIVAMLTSQSDFYAFQDSYRTVGKADEMLLDVSLVASIVLIAVGIIPWHLLRRGKT
jgi:hypothetical protein